MRESSLQTLQRILGPELFGSYWSESKHTLFFPPVTCEDGKTRQSRIVCFGWTDPGRNLSTEYGLIILEQAEQMDREHVAFAQTRLNFFDPWQEARAKELGIASRQLGLICNADDPEHWLNLDYEIEDKGMRVERSRDGRPLYEVILSQAEDNAANLTEDYAQRLESLEGTVWYDRLVGGRWVRAEGLVFGAVWNPSVHIIPRPTEWERWTIRDARAREYGKAMPPPNLPRHRWLDFGVNHPFTCTWGAELPDRTVIAYRELSGTGKAPSEWAAEILDLERAELEAWRAACEAEDARRLRPYLAGFGCATSVSDTDLGWRTELERCGVWTQTVDKDIRSQVAVITSALRENAIRFVSDLLVEPDARLLREKLPTSVLQEIGRYRWRKRPASSTEGGDAKFDVPIDRDNHRIDPLGYFLTEHRGHVAGRVWA
jgi:hypothetical protein